MALERSNFCYDFDGLGGGFHVVHADDVGAVEDGGGDGGQGAVEAIFCGGGGAGFVGEEAADEGFARGAD